MLLVGDLFVRVGVAARVITAAATTIAAQVALFAGGCEPIADDVAGFDNTDTRW